MADEERSEHVSDLTADARGRIRQERSDRARAAAPPEAKKLIARWVPKALKKKLVRRSRELGVSMNDAAVAVLAARFDYAYEAGGRPNPRAGGSATIILEMPAELHERIAARARELETSNRNVAVQALAEEFGEPFEPTGRWPSAAPAST